MVKALGQVTKDNLATFELEKTNLEKGFQWVHDELKLNNTHANLCFDYTAAWDVLHLKLHPREFMYWMSSGLLASRSLEDKKLESYYLGGLGKRSLESRKLSRGGKVLWRGVDHLRGSKFDRALGAMVDRISQYI